MLVDASLLAWAASGSDRAAFRTYGWSRPTLSLGRSEPFPDGWNEDAIASAGVDVVRRPTGGDSVLHDDELTFAVAASVPGPWADGPRAFATLVADALADALRAAGLPAAVVSREEERGPASSAGAHPCFARAAAGEVRVGPYKVAGIASRFTRRAGLSHASVPLSARHRDVARFRRDADLERAALLEHGRSAGELLGRSVDPRALGALLHEALAARFGVAPEETPEEWIVEPE
jgi:lipoate-protein ligase A